MILSSQVSTRTGTASFESNNSKAVTPKYLMSRDTSAMSLLRSSLKAQYGSGFLAMDIRLSAAVPLVQDLRQPKLNVAYAKSLQHHIASTRTHHINACLKNFAQQQCMFEDDSIRFKIRAFFRSKAPCIYARALHTMLKRCGLTIRSTGPIAACG